MPKKDMEYMMSMLEYFEGWAGSFRNKTEADEQGIEACKAAREYIQSVCDKIIDIKPIQ